MIHGAAVIEWITAVAALVAAVGTVAVVVEAMVHDDTDPPLGPRL